MNRRTFALAGVAAGATLALGPRIAAAQQSIDYDRWADVKPMYFGDREVADGSGLLALEAPERAHDAALVPIAVVSKLAPDDPRRIAAVTLLVEGNPVPLAGRFAFPTQRIARLETRVRVESYTYVRAVAELDDGSLATVARFVKASGGCSAAAMKDPEKAMAQLGRMRLRTSGTRVTGGPVTAQVQVRHPNHSGMQFDQISRTYIPAHYVETIEVDYAGAPLIRVKADVSMSEDPSLRFTYRPQHAGDFEVSVRDSKDNVYRQAWSPFAGTAG